MMIPNANGYADNPRALAAARKPLDRGTCPQWIADEIASIEARDAADKLARINFETECDQ